MKSEWKECALKEIINFKNGKKKPSEEGNIPVYGGNGVLGYVNQFNLKKGIAIGRVGAYCGSVYYSDKECWISDNAIQAINNANSDILFDYYLLNSLKLNERKIGTGQPLLTQEILNRIEIKCPPLQTQKKIASILSTLDDKIALNTAINENLEHQLLYMYHHMFDISSNYCELGNVINTTSGGTPSRKRDEYYQNGTNCWVKSKELSGTYIVDTEEKITQSALNQSSAKILPQNSVLIAMYGATVGEYGIISKPMACNQAVCALIPNDSYPYTYLFMFAKCNKQNLINLAVGSAQQNISQVLIKQLQICADIETIHDFHTFAQPLFEQMNTLVIENSRLSTLRDTLLPKLMNGDIEV